MATELRGIYSAMVTPLTADGEAIDEAGLRAIVDRTIEGGIDGLVPCGSTGEFTSLTVDERRRVVEIVLDQAAGRVPVVPQTGALTTKEAVALSAHAAEHGAAGVLAIPAFYEPLGLDEIADYYRAVDAAIDIPIAVYNLPQATGANLEPPFLAKLAGEIPSVQYVKDSTGDLTQVARLVHDYADDIKVFNGADTLLLPALEFGAAGAIIGAPNIVPRQVADVAAAVRAGRHDEALEKSRDIYGLLQFLVTGGYYAALVKAGLDLIDQSAGPLRRPVAPLEEDRREELAGILRAIGVAPAVTAA
jgi:4-hydroxy-tetrahydrodipicolinate synthase